MATMTLAVDLKLGSRLLSVPPARCWDQRHRFLGFSLHRFRQPLRMWELAFRLRWRIPSHRARWDLIFFFFAMHADTNYLRQGSSPPLPPPPTRPFPLPIPTNNLVDAAAQRTTPRELEAFLKTLTNINFSSYSELFTIQGFTIPRLQTLATWSRDEIQETLDCLLMGSGAAAIGQRGMTAVISINFEIAIRNLKSSPPPSAPLPRSLLPPLGSNATNSGTTLSVFLRNVMGFDLSAHSQLMEDQGFSVGTLSGMPAWERARLQEVLRRALLKPTTEAERKMSRLPEGKKGLSGLEVLALEFCIRRARKED
ncbi:hypothetical protein B0H19DRAFT_543888 [Mycena capillaripes]|nr:hypothetical protein B0H19DRAFT_543888 [Mycena capillaripes]